MLFPLMLFSSEVPMPEFSLTVDAQLAREAGRLFQELGLDLPSAVQIFLRQSLREQGLPFTPRIVSRPAGDEPLSEERDEVRPSAALPDSHWQDKAPAVPQASPDTEGAAGDFRGLGVLGKTLRRVRALGRLCAVGAPAPQANGWREVSVSCDEPFALDFGDVRLELACRDGGGLRVMDGRLSDAVLEADAVFPCDLSALFVSILGLELVELSATSAWNGAGETPGLRFTFAGGCSLIFAPGADWGVLRLCDAEGRAMFAPEAVWLKTLDDGARVRIR